MQQQPQEATAPRPDPNRGTVDQALARRERLHAAVVDLETALAPAGSPDVGVVREAVQRVHTTLQDHIREAEAPDGLLAQIAHDEPVYGPRIAELEREHIDLLERSAWLAARSATLGADELGQEAGELARQIDQHRHRATELLLDAYQLDLAAGD